MGGATTMMLSSKTLPDNVKCFIEDCGYTSVWEQFSHQLKSIYSLPKFPIMNASSVVTKFKAGYDFKEASTINQVSNSNTPTSFKSFNISFNSLTSLLRVSMMSFFARSFPSRSV